MDARSYLFVPGDRPERFSKALDTGADAVVIDLEDAVAPAAKQAAREGLQRWLSTTDLTRLIVRVNAVGTPWHIDDVDMVRASGISTMMLPKSDSARQLADVAARLPSQMRIVALIETVAGVVAMREIAGSPSVMRLAFGTVDFCGDAGIEGLGVELNYVRSQMVIESRYAGLPAPIDGVTLELDDLARLTEHVATARRFGFGGKLCIHPRQVDPVNSGFAPSEDERRWASRVLAASREHPQGAFAVDGKLVDRPVIERARRIAEFDALVP
ncbi:citrate lyase subunit beta/citryl-CoA lyase [Paraburkholderia sp. BL27I4N3]|uniref:HpcH/HpaI aldolase/citrate lyase family protein n=1 Tax=Paraburkholderia sp. BL27I4N3 TaxID=1938805 RepID=UPI000E21EE1D|nr:CoA ester lyase [Paraburkholderia sp. BL27I4N3]REE20402.1 citrate lyase subunit beta/citryl-CoA lyase [Paraburkholderia sp. BL27I4N3]